MRTQSQQLRSVKNMNSEVKHENFGAWPKVVDSLTLLDPTVPRKVV